MTSGNMQATSDQVGVLKRKDLAGFDKIATELILEMQLEGWQGFVSQRGHAVMRHPDGSHQSLTRSSNRAKSGVAMRARYESWKRRRAEREAETVTAFGKLQEPPASMPVPVATMLEMKKHPVIGPHLADDSPDRKSAKLAILGDFDTNPRSWAVFDVSTPYPVLMGWGSATTESEAWEVLLADPPPNMKLPAPAESEKSDQEDVMATVFVCPEPGCDKQFNTPQKVGVHNAASHHIEMVNCEVEGCSWTGALGSRSKHFDKMHDATTYPCGFCGTEFTTRTGLAQHKGRKHKGQVEPLVTVTRMDVPVAPPGERPRDEPVATSDATVVSHSEDPLLEHLEHLPEGADAEAMVAQVRSIVAGPLVGEVRRLREELRLMTSERDKFRSEASDFEARLTLMREVMGV